MTEHIDELKLYVKIIWFGDNLRYVTRMLLKQFSDKRSPQYRKVFSVVHWTPSEIIDVDIEYETITMPKCEQFNSEDSKNTMCKYELTPILKYSSKLLKKSTPVYSVFSIINFERKNETHLLQMYNNMTDSQMPTKQPSEGTADNNHNDNDNRVDDKILNNASDKDKLYDEIACRFVREKEQILRDLANLPAQITREKRQVFIGGIYPKQEEAEHEHFGKHANVLSDDLIENYFFLKLIYFGFYK